MLFFIYFYLKFFLFSNFIINVCMPIFIYCGLVFKRIIDFSYFFNYLQLETTTYKQCLCLHLTLLFVLIVDRPSAPSSHMDLGTLPQVAMGEEVGGLLP